ncbi:hypothetical protein [Streptomyces ziwulingensis]|uniref:Uncharacterized protein n=1 Tax=Streptomyces ziwulingensis TaxID=1045501 RepID=A0ABP9D052_9ACTN
MTSRLPAFRVADVLAAAGHTDATRGLSWRPGFRATQASPRTVRIWHDGQSEAQHLARYVATLRPLGYYVTAERPAGLRPRIRVTHP